MAKLSYKVSYYALYVMFAIILVVLGMFFFGGDAQGDAVLASVDAEMWQPAHTDALIYLMYILFFVAIIATVVGVLFQFGAALKDNPGAALKSLIGLVILVAVVVISSYIWVIPKPVIYAAIFGVILVFFTLYTVAGRNLFALGGNKQSAWYSGINTRKYTLLAHTLSSLLAGVGGIVMLARIGAAEPTAGDGYETYAIAACIIGGASLFGGKGKILGVILGGITIGTINNGLNIMNVSSFWQKIVMGLLIIGSVALEKFVSNQAKK